MPWMPKLPPLSLLVDVVDDESTLWMRMTMMTILITLSTMMMMETMITTAKIMIPMEIMSMVLPVRMKPPRLLYSLAIETIVGEGVVVVVGGEEVVEGGDGIMTTKKKMMRVKIFSKMLTRITKPLPH